MVAKVLNDFAIFGGNPYGGYGGYGRSGGGGLWQLIVGVIVGLVLTILLYVLVFPESRKASLNGFFQFIKDFFDMKYLLIEKILKFIYVLNTMTVIAVGFFYLFGSTFVVGLLMIIFGPIVQRLLYESVMLIDLSFHRYSCDEGKQGCSILRWWFPYAKEERSSSWLHSTSSTACAVTSAAYGSTCSAACTVCASTASGTYTASSTCTVGCTTYLPILQYTT